jgi:hypothetical protein
VPDPSRSARTQCLAPLAPRVRCGAPWFHTQRIAAPARDPLGTPCLHCSSMPSANTLASVSTATRIVIDSASCRAPGGEPDVSSAEGRLPCLPTSAGGARAWQRRRKLH